MKNIHIISTPNPSRLWLTKLGNLTRCHDIKPIKEALGNNVNIYITSDKEIKEGDWFLSKEGIVHNNWGWNFGDKKIILTTDQDLIKDGVQAIDDEFLEWFVKKPSCEEVKVEKEQVNNKYGSSYSTITIYKYKIIIPKEEPTEEAKQRAANYMSLKGALEPKQIKCYCGHTTYCDCSPLEEPKQETVEEYLQICKDCGSEEVARCKWVNVNTEEIYSADSGTNLEWCFDCKSETNIIDKEDYETKIQ